MPKTPIIGQLLLLSTRFATAGPYLEAAEKLGVHHALALETGGTEPPAEAMAGELLQRDFLRLQFDTRDSALAIVEYAMEHPLAAILAVDERCAPSAARAASMIGLPGNPPKAADACLDKFTLRQQLSNAGIPAPLLVGVNDPAPTAQSTTGHSHEVSKQANGVVAILNDGKMRVLATTHGIKIGPNPPRSALETVWRAARVVMLKHGPVFARIETADNRTTVLDLAAAVPDQLAAALRFKIPLVAEDISLAEVILRHALGLDISRVHPLG